MAAGAVHTDSPGLLTGGWQPQDAAADRWRSWPHVDSSVTSESSWRLTLHLLSSCFPEISNDKQSQNRSHMSPNACGSAWAMFFQLPLVLNATANTRAARTHTRDEFQADFPAPLFPEPHGPSRPCPAQPLHPCPMAPRTPAGLWTHPCSGQAAVSGQDVLSVVLPGTLFHPPGIFKSYAS